MRGKAAAVATIAAKLEPEGVSFYRVADGASVEGIMAVHAATRTLHVENVDFLAVSEESLVAAGLEVRAVLEPESHRELSERHCEVHGIQQSGGTENFVRVLINACALAGRLSPAKAIQATAKLALADPSLLDALQDKWREPVIAEIERLRSPPVVTTGDALRPDVATADGGNESS